MRYRSPGKLCLPKMPVARLFVSVKIFGTFVKYRKTTEV